MTMLSVQTLFGLLDMYRGSVWVKSTESKQQYDCGFNRRKTPAGFIMLIKDVFFVKLSAIKHTRHIQMGLHTRRTGGGQIR